MLAQKSDSIWSPFSDKYSKVDILQNSKKGGGDPQKSFFGVKRLLLRNAGGVRLNAQPLADESVSLFTIRTDLIEKAAQPRPGDTWTSAAATRLAAPLEGTSTPKPASIFSADG